MPRIVGAGGLASPGSDKPVERESRVIILQLLIKAGAGNSDYAITPPLGNRVRLLGVDVWFQPTSQGGFIKAYLKVTTGTGTGLSADIVGWRWPSVMDTTMIMKVGMLIFCCDLHLHFNMNKLYIGESQKFGIWSESNANVQYSILAAFLVAEG